MALHIHVYYTFQHYDPSHVILAHVHPNWPIVFVFGLFGSMPLSATPNVFQISCLIAFLVNNRVSLPYPVLFLSVSSDSILTSELPIFETIFLGSPAGVYFSLPFPILFLPSSAQTCQL